MKPTDEQDSPPGNPEPSQGVPALGRKVQAFLPDEDLSFAVILAESFKRLENKRDKDTLKRIYRMEAVLEQLERDLDEFINAGLQYNPDQ
ncbi:MAG: hypothetical protein LBQ44_11140 [Treponema sp.]|nr:hypothetical protein [Treponema sp.]